MTIQDKEEYKKNASSAAAGFRENEPEEVLGYQLNSESDNENIEEAFYEKEESDHTDALPETVLGFDLTEATYEKEDEENTYDVFLKLELIEQQLNNLSLEIQSKLKNDEHKDKIIDMLHQELQAYKNDLINKEFVSMVSDLIKLIDDTRKITMHYRSSNASSHDPQKLLELLESIPSDIEDIFSWHGIKTYSLDGRSFDPGKQQALKKIETQDKSKDRTVAERYRAGYKLNDKIIRPEIVDVYVYSEAPVEPPPDTGRSNG